MESLAGYLIAVEALGGTAVEDSWIGIHADGTPGPGVINDLSNQREGVILLGGSALRRSVLGQNTWAAVETCGTDVEIVDTKIGTDPTGLIARPNYYGVLIGSTQSCATSDTAPVVVGRPGHGNVISGNATLGLIADQPNVVVESNLIGVGADSSTPLGNDGGIGLRPAAIGAVVDHNVVRNNGHWGIYVDAKDAVLSDNEVTASALDGVVVSTGQHVQLRDNRIDGNGGLGIDLGRDGVTQNDASDADTGSNGLQNFPTIASVTRFGQLLTIAGSLSTTPSTKATIELFQSPTCDPSGYGEGALSRGSIATTVPTSGTTTWQWQLPVDDAAGTAWTATATTSDGTSEFSPCTTDTMATTPQPTLTAWQPIGGAAKGAPSVAAPDVDTFDTVIRGLDNQIWYADKASTASAWSSWRSIGGLTPSSPAASVHDVVVRGNDNALWLRTIGQANAWQPLGGLTLDSPALTRTADGTLHLFIRGVDEALWHRERSTAGQWGPCRVSADASPRVPPPRLPPAARSTSQFGAPTARSGSSPVSAEAEPGARGPTSAAEFASARPGNLRRRLAAPVPSRTRQPALAPRP